MLSRLFRQSSTYALVNVVAKLSGFVLMAFYGDEDVISTTEFGYFDGLNAVMMFSILIASLGLPLGIIRFATNPALTEAERDAVPITALVLSVLAGGVFVAVGWALAAPAAGVFLEAPQRAEAMRWLAVFVGFKVVSDVSYTVLRQRERVGLFAVIGAIEAVLLVAAVIWFLLDGQELVGIMKGYALSAGVVAAVVTPALVSRVPRRVHWGLVRPMLAFGLPLIVSGLAGRFLNLGDRYIIIYLLGPEANGVYGWAARFGGVVNTLLVQSFVLAFTVLGLKSLDQTGSPELHRQSVRHFAALAGWVVLGLGLFVNDVSDAMTDKPEFLGIEGLVVLIAGGFAFYGLYYVVVNILYAAGRTRAVVLAVGGAAVLNLALNLALIPVIGIDGAAVATLASYAALALGTAWLAQATTPTVYPWRALAAVVGLTMALWLAAQPSADWSLGARLATRATLALAYLPGLVLLGVYGRDDLARARSLLTREHDRSTPEADERAR